VVEADGQGGLLPLEQAQEMYDWAPDSLRDGIIPEESFARGLDALRNCAAWLKPFRPESTVAVATSAIREARNGAEFVSAVKREVGLSVDVLDPFKEAQLIYWGARQTLNLEKHKVALFDVGGGFDQGLVGDAKECLFATSMPWAYCACATSAASAARCPRADMLTAETRVRVLVQPAIRQMQKVGFDFVTFTSGTALAPGPAGQGQRRQGGTRPPENPGKAWAGTSPCRSRT